MSTAIALIRTLTVSQMYSRQNQEGFVALDTSLLQLLHRAVQVGTEKFSKALGDADLTARQLVILQAIEANDGASQTAIVNITGIDRSTLADVTQRLLKRRLISRKRDKKDSRAYCLSLTADGKRATAHAAPVLQVVEREMLGALPVKDRTALLGMLTVVSAG